MSDPKRTDTTELVMILARLAITHGPTIADSIRRMMNRDADGATVEEYDRAVKILSKNPEDYFGPRRDESDGDDSSDEPEVDDGYYPAMFDEEPDAGDYRAGDELWTTGAGRWFVLTPAMAAFGFVKPEGSRKVSTY